MPAQFFLRNTQKGDKSTKHTEVNLNTFKVTKPLVVCFSGNSTTNMAQANGFCKIAERELRLLFDEKENSVANKPFPMSENIDVMGVVYEPKMYAKGTGIGGIDFPTLGKFVKKVLMPLCLDKQGKKIKVDKAQKNMSLITFFSYCHGARETVKTMEIFCGNLRDANYNPKEIKSILGSMLEVSFSPNVVGYSLVPRVDLISAKDSTYLFIEEDFEDKFDRPIQGIEFDYKAPTFFENGTLYSFDTLSVISSKMRNSSTAEIDEHDASLINRGDDWEGNFVRPDGSEVYYGKNADAMSQLSSYVLCYAVSNGLENAKSKFYVPKMSLKEIEEDLKSIKNSFSKEDLSPQSEIEGDM